MGDRERKDRQDKDETIQNKMTMMLLANKNNNKSSSKLLKHKSILLKATFLTFKTILFVIGIPCLIMYDRSIIFDDAVRAATEVVQQQQQQHQQHQQHQSKQHHHHGSKEGEEGAAAAEVDVGASSSSTKDEGVEGEPTSSGDVPSEELKKNKRNRNGKKNAQPSYIIDLNQLKVPTPIFVLNLPKSGTQTIDRYFKCGLGYKQSTHHWMRNATNHLMRIGECMGGNYFSDSSNSNNNTEQQQQRTRRKLLDGCGNYQVYADGGAMWNEEEDKTTTIGNNNINRATTATTTTTTTTTKDNKRNKRILKPVKKCFYPGMTYGLEQIVRDYPNATIVHIPRDTEQWLASAKNWNRILLRISNYCTDTDTSISTTAKTDTDTTGRGGEVPQFPPTTTMHKNNSTSAAVVVDDQKWMNFYNDYTNNIRQFVSKHPSLTYIEGKLEDTNTIGQLLEAVTGISRNCWGHHHKTSNVPWMKKKQE